jgi:hypothetical protein
MDEEKEIEVKSNVHNMELYSDNYPFRLSLRINNFESETEYVKFIKNCEALIRRSIEYKHWREYIIDILGIQTCAITNEKMDEVSIDVHHHVPSLYILVSALVNESIENEKEFCTFDISQKAIELHFMNKVGYVTLIKSMHEKFHNNYLNVPIGLVKGDYNYFIQNYSKYLDDEDLDSINERLSITESNCNWSRDEYVTSSGV